MNSFVNQFESSFYLTPARVPYNNNSFLGNWRESRISFDQNNGLLRLSLDNKVKKCKVLQNLLLDDWQRKIRKAPFLSVLDSRKVAFGTSVGELNKLLQSGIFNEREKKSIKKLRYQGRNNKAAKTLRLKNKKNEFELQNSLSQLNIEKEMLELEKSKLLHEISFYKNPIQNS